MDIQNHFLLELANKLGSKKKVANALMETLDISQDSVYRRTRGETQFTIGEMQKLCLVYDISFDTLIGSPDKSQIFFTKRDLGDIDYNFTNYLKDILKEGMKVQNVKNIELMIASQDFPLFKLFNYPQLARFKFIFWSQNIVHKEDRMGEKYKFEDLTSDQYNFAYNILLAYSRVESVEILNLNSIQGIIREIRTHYFKNRFDSKNTAIKLLNSVRKLTSHMEEECDTEKKIIPGYGPQTEHKNYRCYLNQAYIPDNTLLVESSVYSAVFLTHNCLNFISTNNAKYIQDTKETFTGYKRNCLQISGKNEDVRRDFFQNVRDLIDEIDKEIKEA
jgi:hypothetical protein